MARSNRQRKVIEALIVQAKKVSPAKYAEMVRTMMSLCETSLSFSEIMSFAPMITKDITIQTLTIPGDEENAIGGMYDGAWVWRYDLSEATQHIHEFIYGEPLDTVPDSVISANDSGSSNNKSDSDDDDNDNNNKNSDKGNQGGSNLTTKPAGTTAPATTAPTTAPTTTAPTTEPTTGNKEEPVTNDGNAEEPATADQEENTAEAANENAAA